MITGIGTDIVEIKRIEYAIEKYGDRFLNKIFTNNEIEFCKKRTNFVHSLAKMFAIKEATGKAISDMRGIGWRDIEVDHDKFGKPIVLLHNKAKEKIKSCTNIFVSTSDEKLYATAFVIIVGK